MRSCVDGANDQRAVGSQQKRLDRVFEDEELLPARAGVGRFIEDVAHRLIGRAVLDPDGLRIQGVWRAGGHSEQHDQRHHAETKIAYRQLLPAGPAVAAAVEQRLWSSGAAVGAFAGDAIAADVDHGAIGRIRQGNRLPPRRRMQKTHRRERFAVVGRAEDVVGLAPRRGGDPYRAVSAELDPVHPMISESPAQQFPGAAPVATHSQAVEGGGVDGAVRGDPILRIEGAAVADGVFADPAKRVAAVARQQQAKGCAHQQRVVVAGLAMTAHGGGESAVGSSNGGQCEDKQKQEPEQPHRATIPPMSGAQCALCECPRPPSIEVAGRCATPGGRARPSMRSR